jgi:hypothetical protein
VIVALFPADFPAGNLILRDFIQAAKITGPAPDPHDKNFCFWTRTVLSPSESEARIQAMDRLVNLVKCERLRRFEAPRRASEYWILVQRRASRLT